MEASVPGHTFVPWLFSTTIESELQGPMTALGPAGVPATVHGAEPTLRTVACTVTAWAGANSSFEIVTLAERALAPQLSSRTVTDPFLTSALDVWGPVAAPAAEAPILASAARTAAALQRAAACRIGEIGWRIVLIGSTHQTTGAVSLAGPRPTISS
jgi:hypothetical protein